MSDSPKLFRVTLEVADLERATQLYAALFGLDGQRYPGGRHLEDQGGWAVVAPVARDAAYQRERLSDSPPESYVTEQ
jgi:hypothetical protein